jgi:hypothetical protein
MMHADTQPPAATPDTALALNMAAQASVRSGRGRYPVDIALASRSVRSVRRGSMSTRLYQMFRSCCMAQSSPCTRTAAPKAQVASAPVLGGTPSPQLNSDRSVVPLPRRALAAASWACCHVSVAVTHLLPPIALEHIPSEHGASRA